MEAKFYGASILHHKISKSWHIIESSASEKDIEALGARFVQAMLTFAGGPRMLLSKVFQSIYLTQMVYNIRVLFNVSLTEYFNIVTHCLNTWGNFNPLSPCCHDVTE